MLAPLLALIGQGEKDWSEPSMPYDVARTRKGMAPSPPARDAAIASLSELLGDRLSSGDLVRQQHGRDASYHPCMPPDAVAFAQSTEEVSEIVRICARHKVPMFDERANSICRQLTRRSILKNRVGPTPDASVKVVRVLAALAALVVAISPSGCARP
jgi:hypothetical protein